MQWQLDGRAHLGQRQQRQVQQRRCAGRGASQLAHRRRRRATAIPGVLDLQASLAGPTARACGATCRWRCRRPRATTCAIRCSRPMSPRRAFRVKGDLRDFPFAHGRTGEFRVTAQVRDATYAFVPPPPQRTAALPWPALTQLSAQLVFERNSMRIEDAQGRMAARRACACSADAPSPTWRNTSVRRDRARCAARWPRRWPSCSARRSTALTQEALAKATATGNDRSCSCKLGLPIAHLEHSTRAGHRHAGRQRRAD